MWVLGCWFDSLVVVGLRWLSLFCWFVICAWIEMFGCYLDVKVLGLV